MSDSAPAPHEGSTTYRVVGVYKSDRVVLMGNLTRERAEHMCRTIACGTLWKNVEVESESEEQPPAKGSGGRSGAERA